MVSSGSTHLCNGFGRLEYEAWTTPGVALAYDSGFGPLTQQAISVLLKEIDKLAISKSKHSVSVLDVATGPGYVARSLVRDGYNVVAVDCSEEFIRMAQVFNKDLELGKLHFKVGDAQRLEFDDCTFDAVVCNFGVLHLPEPEMFFREAFRVLRPGGLLAFTVWQAPPATVGFDMCHRAVREHSTVSMRRRLRPQQSCGCMGCGRGQQSHRGPGGGRGRSAPPPLPPFPSLPFPSLSLLSLLLLRRKPMPLPPAALSCLPPLSFISSKAMERGGEGDTEARKHPVLPPVYPPPSPPLPLGPKVSRAHLESAGFIAASSREVSLTMELSSESHLFEALLNGTARSRALLRAQTPEALAAVRKAVEAECAALGLSLPMPCVLVTARRADK
uniref:Type 11 methyltransferase n=1 Tax=Tetraselmis sp. GSL018 TaxID=582737 RepID=A0A061SG58_9CHLO